MCQIIKHKNGENCRAENIYISGFGLACGACNRECECEKKRHERQREEINNVTNWELYPDYIKD